MTPELLLTFLAVSLLLLALVALGESALLGFPRFRRRQLVDEGNKRALRLDRLLERPQRVMLAALVANVGLRTLAVASAVFLGLELADARAWPPAAALATTLGATVIGLVVLAEVLPKAVGTERAERVAIAAAPAFAALAVVLRPFTFPLEKLAARTYRASGTSAEDGAAHFKTEEELKTLITLGTEEGILEEGEEEMIHSVIEFGQTTAKEIMVPRIDMTAVPGDATLDHVRAFVLESGYSRVPVYQGSVDNVVGVLYVKDMLVKLIEGKGPTPVRDLAREPFYVPETKKLDELLQEMREKRIHMAVVLDEFGGTAGLLTLEDLLEEIVGEIFDEYDLRTDPVRRLDDVTAVVDARTLVADVNAQLDLDIPEDEPYDTVGGYVFHKLGRLGKEGEVVHAESFDMIVEKVSNRRILRVRIVKRAPAPLSSDEEADEREAAPE